MAFRGRGERCAVIVLVCGGKLATTGEIFCFDLIFIPHHIVVNFFFLED